MGEWVRRGASGRSDHSSFSKVEEGLLVPPEDPEEKTGSNTLLSRWQERSQSVQRLEDGYQRLSGLIESIQKHLESQDERTKNISDGMVSLANTISKLPDSLAEQQTQLRAIVEQLESANTRSARLDAAIAEIPKLADAQRETFLAIREEIDATRQVQNRIVDSMDGFREAVGTLTLASSTTVETLKSLHAIAAAGDERLTTVLTEQNKKFSRLLVVAIVMAAVLAAANIVSIFVT